MIKTRCACGAKYAFEDAAAGKRAKCKRCGALFNVGPGDPDEVVELAPPPLVDGGYAVAALPAEPAGPPAVRSWQGSDEIAEAARLRAGHGRDVELDFDERPPTSYGSSLIWALAFPTTMNNVIMFVVALAMMLIANVLLAFAPLIGYFGQLILTGWFCSFRFQIIADAANGEEELPSIVGAEGAWEDIALPLLRWLGSWAVVLAPAAVFLLIYPPTTLLNGPPPTSIVALFQLGGASFGGLTALLLLGLICWPMVALCVALGGFATFARADLMFTTALRTLPAYALTVLAVLLFDAIPFGALYLAVQPGAGGGMATRLNSELAARSLYTCCDVYGEIVSAKLIGLYYHHFKRRFAWSWG